MATIFKRKGRNGKPAAKYSIQYKDGDGKWKVVVGCADKESTRLIAKKLEDEAILERSGIRVTRGTAPLPGLIREFHDHLDAKGNSEQYVSQTVKRVTTTFAACGFTKLDDLRSDIAAGKLSNYIASLTTRKGPKGKEHPVSQQTRNHYLTVVKTFCHWAVASGKLPDCRLLFLKRIKVTENSRRRAASKDELARIIRAAEKGADAFELTGAQRAMLYRTAVGTGFRAGELADLLPQHFFLNAKTPHIQLPARSVKNRQDAPQPISDDLAKRLRKFIRGIEGPIWPGTWGVTAAEMLRVDLAAAEIPYETSDGVLDFHALRTSFITNLARAGVHPRVAQQLARHSDINLTMQVYTKLELGELANALNSV